MSIEIAFERVSALSRRRRNAAEDLLKNLYPIPRKAEPTRAPGYDYKPSVKGKFRLAFRQQRELDFKIWTISGLRNAIRHSRAVDEITRKEGEAAIICLSKSWGSHSL